MANEIAQKQETVIGLIRKSQSQFLMALGNPALAERFVRVAITEVRRNPMLQNCEATSLIGALMLGAQLNLDITLEQYYIIPYWSSKNNCYLAQFQFGYKGLIELFYRHPLAAELYAETVYSKDKFEVNLGTDRKIIHEPNFEDRGEPILYYAVAKLSTGATNFAIMSKKEVDQHKERYAKSKTKSISPWETNFEDMAKKTVIKKVLKYMPKSVEIASALINDESVRYAVGEIKSKEDFESLPVSYPEFLNAPVEEEPKPEPEKKSEKVIPKSKQAPKEEESEPKVNPDIDIIALKNKLLERINTSNMTKDDKDNLKSRVMLTNSIDELSLIDKTLVINER